uniref:Uncharacterized protein n=1 Tax=Nelumbo nucifera TaxID=4432 RepID=A0A822ZTX3_NELNU|nr:TPA_asm: hypothetical protein HUJ06_016908 [Nelumbo nucifera]
MKHNPCFKISQSQNSENACSYTLSILFVTTHFDTVAIINFNNQ